MMSCNENYAMTCKDGFVHNFTWFEILSKTMCIHCGTEKQ